jgi:hypothetical protein
MAARKGLVRLARLACVLAALGYGGYYAYDELFKPGEIKRRVVEELSAKFEGVDVEVGSARLRPFLGGVNVSDLKLIRRDDPNRTPFLHVPHAVIWYDKADFAHRLRPAKIELEDAQLRVVRDAQGHWNVEGIAKPAPEGEQAPVFVLRKAHVEVVDQANGSTAVLDLQEMDLTVVNDPVAVYTYEARGKADPVGPFHARGRFEKGVGAAGTLDLSSITLGEPLARLIGLAAPEAVEPLRTVTGTAGCRTRWTWKPGRQPELSYDTEFDLRDGRCTGANLPHPLEHLAVKARVHDGELTVESLTGQLGDCGLTVKLELDAAPAPPGAKAILLSPVDLEDRLRRLEITLTDLKVGAELFDKLPQKYRAVQEIFAPAGVADATYEQRRDKTGLRKKCVLRPKGMAARYRGFPYPVDHIRGTVEATLDDDVPPRYEVDLVGEGSGKAVTLKGYVIGGPEREVDLVLTGSDVVLDKTLIDALPDEYPALMRRLQATAKGDFTAKLRHNARIRREHGPEVFDNEFTITIRAGGLTYEEFPYPLRDLAGVLKIRTVPDYPTAGRPGPPDDGVVEFKEFTAAGSGGCKLTINGGRKSEPGGAVLELRVNGESVPLDGELGRAVAKLKIDNSWNTFAPTGRMNCDIHAFIHDRVGPDGQPLAFHPNRDLELGLSFNGPAIRPTFFPYLFTDVAGQVSFAQGKVTVPVFRAKHGATTVTLGSATILLPPTGGFWADLYDLRFTSVVCDREFLAALPRGMRSACLGLEPQGPIAVHAKRLVIDDRPKSQAAPTGQLVSRTVVRQVGAGSPQPERTTLPIIYWDGTVTFRDAALKTGVSWDHITGEFSSRGLYLGDRLGRVVGNLAIDKGRVLKQPIEALSARLEVDPAKPDTIAIPWINARAYGGEIGGEARVDLGTPVRFDLSLTGARLKLEEFARVNKLGPKTDIEGLATAQIKLTNAPEPGTRTPILQGSGSIDVPNGKMLDLPVMLDVIKLARLRPIDRTAFEEAHAVFRIRGDRVKVGQLDLLGNAISLGGEGDMKLDGTDALFEFYTVWTNIRNLLGNGGDLAARVSGNLFRIRVAGDLGADRPPRVTQEALPGIVDPIRRLMGRVAPK